MKNYVFANAAHFNYAMNIAGGHSHKINPAKPFSALRVGSQIFKWNTVTNTQDKNIPFVIVKLIEVLPHGDLRIEYENPNIAYSWGEIIVNPNASYDAGAEICFYATGANGVKEYYLDLYRAQRQNALTAIAIQQKRLRELNSLVYKLADKEIKLSTK